MGWFLGIITACVIGLIVFAAVSAANVGHRKGDAERSITRLCAPRGGAVFYDVQGENKMVFACNDNHILQVRAY